LSGGAAPRPEFRPAGIVTPVPGTRFPSGHLELDRIADLVARGDATALLALMRFEPRQCVERRHKHKTSNLPLDEPELHQFAAPPECPPGVISGTPGDAFLVHCGDWVWVTRAHAEATLAHWLSGAPRRFGAYRITRRSATSGQPIEADARLLAFSADAWRVGQPSWRLLQLAADASATLGLGCVGSDVTAMLRSIGGKFGLDPLGGALPATHPPLYPTSSPPPASPTPVPTPLPRTRSPLGDPRVDATITAAESADVDALLALMRYQLMICSPLGIYSGPPRCPPGVALTTRVETFGTIQCEGEPVLREQTSGALARFLSARLRLFGAFEWHPATAEHWLPADALVLFSVVGSSVPDEQRTILVPSEPDRDSYLLNDCGDPRSTATMTERLPRIPYGALRPLGTVVP